MSQLLHKTRLLGLALSAFFANACGESGTNSTKRYDMKYSLQRVYTGKTQNQLTIDVEDPEQFTFVMAGEGFESDTPLNERLPLQKTVNLSYPAEGTYDITLKIIRRDGVNFVNQRLQWTYSRKKPTTLVAAFEEAATSNGRVHVLFPPQLDPDTTEVWAEGDLLSHPKGQWLTIPPDLVLPLTVSEPDGLKTVQLKYRNIYGNEGPMTTLQILKKSVGPKDCEAEPSSNRSYKTDVQVFLAANNDGPLFYKFAGDVDESSWVQFDDGQVDAIVNLNRGNGAKHVIVSIRDIADNRCPDIALDLTVDDQYPPYQLTVKDGLLWTDDINITVEPRYDHLPDDKIEMFLSGNIQNSNVTGKWLALREQVNLKLTPVDGNRFIYAQFRNKKGDLSDRAYVSIFLKPFLQATRRSSSTWTLTPSHFTSLSTMTITGCRESYSNIAYKSTLVCTPTSHTISAAYLLNDHSIVTRNTTLP